MTKIKLGTRGSELALIQANHVKSLLEAYHDNIDVELVVITTSGDWKPEQIVGSEHVLANGGEVKSLRFEEGYSTSKLIKDVQGKS